nr:unnamed protein product [Digitaria exilis]
MRHSKKVPDAEGEGDWMSLEPCGGVNGRCTGCCVSVTGDGAGQALPQRPEPPLAAFAISGQLSLLLSDDSCSSWINSGDKVFRFGVVREGSMAGGLKGLSDLIPGDDWVKVSGSGSSRRAPWPVVLEECMAAAVGTAAWSQEANDNRRQVPTAGTSGFLGAQNAWDMLSEEQSQKHITTGSGDLNNILGGGIHCKEVTEIGGVPGVGKTQLGIQLAINVQIPVEYGGLGGKAVYIDTEGSFMVERVYQIAEGCISDILEHFPHSHEKSSFAQKQLQPEHFLADIYYFRVCSYTEQIAAINYLEKFLGEHKDVRIVIIDSVTFHFRQDFDDMALRTRVLSGLSLKLMKIAKAYNLAVVLLNQVTTKFAEGSFQLTLALGQLSFIQL